MIFFSKQFVNCTFLFNSPALHFHLTGAPRSTWSSEWFGQTNPLLGQLVIISLRPLSKTLWLCSIGDRPGDDDWNWLNWQRAWCLSIQSSSPNCTRRYNSPKRFQGGLTSPDGPQSLIRIKAASFAKPSNEIARRPAEKHLKLPPVIIESNGWRQRRRTGLFKSY